MSGDLRAAVEGLPTFGWRDSPEDEGSTVKRSTVLALIPEGAVLVTKPEIDPWQELHDNGFSWDDVNAIASICAHHGWDILREGT